MRRFPAKTQLDETTTRHLIDQYQRFQDEDALKRLVECHTSLVASIARKFFADLQEDLLQEGFVGLICSVRKFDLAQPTKFSTFAYHYIRGWILQYLNNKASIVHYPEGGIVYCKSLDTPIFTDEETTFLDTLVCSRPSPEDLAIRSDILAKLAAVIKKLGVQEQFVVKRYFWEDATLAQVGQEIGVSRETVRRMGEKALIEIKESLLSPTEKRGVRIHARALRRKVQQQEPVHVFAEKLKSFAILGYTISTQGGDHLFTTENIDTIKNTLTADQVCIVRIGLTTAVPRIAELVQLLSRILQLPQKQIIVELKQT